MWLFGVKNDINKRIKEAGIEAEIKNINKRLRVLECDHKKTAFISNYGDWSEAIYYREGCSECGKTLRSFDNEKDYLEAKNDKMAELIKENEEKITKL